MEDCSKRYGQPLYKDWRIVSNRATSLSSNMSPHSGHRCVCVCGGGGGTTTISDYVVIFCDFVVVLYCLPYAGSDGRRTGCVVPTSNSRETPPRVPH